MVVQKNLRGAVVISYANRSHGAMELLAARMRHRIDLTYCNHPNELELTDDFRFILVFSVRDLASAVNVYNARNTPVPLIIHIDNPEAIRTCNYVELFPYVEIAPMPQEGLHDITEKVDFFERIIAFLERLAA